MPTRADLEAATPKCPREVQGARCGELLRWDPVTKGWVCPRHMLVLAAYALVKRQAA